MDRLRRECDTELVNLIDMVQNTEGGNTVKRLV